MKQFIQCPECGIPIIADIIPNSGKLKNVSTIGSQTIYWNHKDCSNGMSMEENDYHPLSALSIRQPWAWLIVNGYKPIENRSTLKNFKGTFLIHASIQFDCKWRNKIHPHIVKLINNIIDGEYQYFRKGGIIGYATITECVQKSDSPWFSGPNGFIIKDPHPIPFTPCKGKLSFFKPDINENTLQSK